MAGMKLEPAAPAPDPGRPGRRERLHHGGVLLVLVAAAGVWAAVLAAVALGRGPWASSPATVVGAVLGLVLGLSAIGVRLRRWRAGRWTDRSAAPIRLLLYCATGRGPAWCCSATR